MKWPIRSSGVDPNLRQVVDAALLILSLVSMVRFGIIQGLGNPGGGRARHDDIKGYLQSFIRTLYTGGPIEGWNPPIYNSILNAYILAKAPSNVDGAFTKHFGKKLVLQETMLQVWLMKPNEPLPLRRLQIMPISSRNPLKEHSRKNNDSPRPGERGTWEY